MSLVIGVVHVSSVIYNNHQTSLWLRHGDDTFTNHAFHERLNTHNAYIQFSREPKKTVKYIFYTKCRDNMPLKSGTYTTYTRTTTTKTLFSGTTTETIALA